MRIPDPKANTTTEAYLAYKSGYLEENELKPVLYEPYLHFDAWLAYWAGLTTTYPVTISKKNLFGLSTILATGCTYTEENGVYTITATANSPSFRVELKQTIPAGAYTWSGGVSGWTISPRKTDGTSLGVNYTSSPHSFTTTADMGYVTFFSGIQAGQTAVLDLSDFMIEAGSTPTEYEPYATPEMLNDEEALVAYLSGVTDTYPEEIKDPYDVRIVGYLKHLASIRWPEPDYPVNNEEFYLSNMEPTHTSNLVPSSDIELDTVEGKIISVEAYGDTYQQTYSGKNLLTGDYSSATAQGIIRTWDNVYVTLSGTTSSTYANISQNNIGIPLDAGTYTFSTSKASSINKVIRIRYSDANYTYIIEPNTTSITFEIPDGTTDAVFNLLYISGFSPGVQISDSFGLMLEKSSSPSPFEPYTGKIPAPNPSYPTPINVVTGTQTITITDGTKTQNFIVDLGTTELCKIGDYQDYIYKSGDDWYVHKALSKYVFNGNETINYQSLYGGFTISSGNLISYMPGIQTPLNGYSNYFIIETSTTTWTGEGKIGLSASGTFWAKSTAFGSTQQTCEAWLSTNTPTVYYVLATSTDTKITDATLIGQLDSLAGADTYDGKTFIKVTANDPNLPALLKVEAYKY